MGTRDFQVLTFVFCFGRKTSSVFLGNIAERGIFLENFDTHSELSRDLACGNLLKRSLLSQVGPICMHRVSEISFPYK